MVLLSTTWATPCVFGGFAMLHAIAALLRPHPAIKWGVVAIVGLLPITTIAAKTAKPKIDDYCVQSLKNDKAFKKFVSLDDIRRRFQWPKVPVSTSSSLWNIIR